MPLGNLSTIVGKNDSGKSIILNAIASFFNIKNYPISFSDFNDKDLPITFEITLYHKNLKEILETKIKSKIKKDNGLDEFLEDIIFDDCLIFKKVINKEGKSYTEELFLIQDFVDDNFSSLYQKKDTELDAIISQYHIDIPIEGVGRNSKIEKIKFIKKYCKENNIPTVNKFILDEFKIGSLLPQVELFVSDYGLEADTKFKTNSVSEISDFFDRNTQDENMPLRLIEKNITAEMQNEAESIKQFMSDYTSALQKVEINPQIVWKDAIKNVTVSFQFEGDPNPIPMTHKGTGYRRLFMVARFRYLAEKNNGNNVIYLIEEPEAFLHPSAQNDLLNALKELSEDNQVIITTHSPVFAGATNTDSIILSKRDTQTIYQVATEENKEEFIFNIVEELGIKPSFNLRDKHEKILFVESLND